MARAGIEAVAQPRQSLLLRSGAQHLREAGQLLLPSAVRSDRPLHRQRGRSSRRSDRARLDPAVPIRMSLRR
jgi:hypothetical protein